MDILPRDTALISRGQDSRSELSFGIHGRFLPEDFWKAASLSAGHEFLIPWTRSSFHAEQERSLSAPVGRLCRVAF